MKNLKCFPSNFYPFNNHRFVYIRKHTEARSGVPEGSKLTHKKKPAEGETKELTKEQAEQAKKILQQVTKAGGVFEKQTKKVGTAAEGIARALPIKKGLAKLKTHVEEKAREEARTEEAARKKAEAARKKKEEEERGKRIKIVKKTKQEKNRENYTSIGRGKVYEIDFHGKKAVEKKTHLKDLFDDEYLTVTVGADNLSHPERLDGVYFVKKGKNNDYYFVDKPNERVEIWSGDIVQRSQDFSKETKDEYLAMVKGPEKKLAKRKEVKLAKKKEKVKDWKANKKLARKRLERKGATTEALFAFEMAYHPDFRQEMEKRYFMEKKGKKSSVEPLDPTKAETWTKIHEAFMEDENYIAQYAGIEEIEKSTSEAQAALKEAEAGEEMPEVTGTKFKMKMEQPEITERVPMEEAEKPGEKVVKKPETKQQRIKALDEYIKNRKVKGIEDVITLLYKKDREALHNALLKFNSDFDFTFKNKDDVDLLEKCLKRADEIPYPKRSDIDSWYALAEKLAKKTKKEPQTETEEKLPMISRNV